jgi:hypothetical protein
MTNPFSDPVRSSYGMMGNGMMGNGMMGNGMRGRQFHGGPGHITKLRGVATRAFEALTQFTSSRDRTTRPSSASRNRFEVNKNYLYQRKLDTRSFQLNESCLHDQKSKIRCMRHREPCCTSCEFINISVDPFTVSVILRRRFLTAHYNNPGRD